MSELSGRCQEPCCLTESNPKSKRLYRCLYHCQQELCINHLNEHDQYIDKKDELKDLGNELSEHIHELLSIDHSHDLTDKSEVLRKVIETLKKASETVKKATVQGNQSKSIISDIDPKIESVINDEEVNQLTIDYGATSHGNQNNNINISSTEHGFKVTNNNDVYEPSIQIKDRTHEKNADDFKVSRILNWVIDNDDKTDQSDNEIDAYDAKEHRAGVTSENIHPVIRNNNRCDQKNHVDKQPATMVITSSSSELLDDKSIPDRNQGAFEKSESTNCLEDVIDSKESSPPKSDDGSSELSCY